MSAVCVSQSGTGGGGLELEQGGGWGEVPSTGVAPAGRTPAFLEAASPPSLHVRCVFGRPARYLGHLA